MEDLLLSPVEQKLLLKYKRFLQNKYKVSIALSECVSPCKNDVVIARVHGEKINFIKNFIQRQMAQREKKQKQRVTVENNVPTITISDSDSDSSVPAIMETRNVRNQTRKRKKSRFASTETNQLEDLSSTIVVDDSEESGNEASNQAQKRLKEELPVPTDFIPLSTGNNTNNMGFYELDCSASTSTNVNFEPSIPSDNYIMQRFMMDNAQINGNYSQHVADNSTIQCDAPQPGYLSLLIGKEITPVKDAGDIIILEDEIPRPVVKEPKCLRPIVIDGSNVAREHGKINNSFSCKGIKIAIDYFMRRGHTQVTAFVPQFRRHCKFGPILTTDQPLLEELAKEQRVVFTPSRRINNRRVSCYDDRFIVDLATQNGGVILSNDNYRDIAEESDIFKKTIDERLLMFCFVGDIIMIPQDPLGRDGPSLDTFLSFPA